ncbi:pre-rRNA-processing protein TSR1 homolog [Diadema antillarum]|uniref:pre-rRNA-processing protein TSR1 homolog n=1 Tax=Diadema antillarum TaxID=105358 RepID=UPI003A8985A6
MAKTSHRAGPLKQQNKGHKTGRHRSKGKIDVQLKGKVNATTISRKWKRELSKADRRNKALQLRKQKRDELLSQKRMGGVDAPPNLVMVLPLHGAVDVDRVVGCLRAADSDAVEYPSSNSNLLHICLPRFKRRFSIVVPSSNLSAILDTAKAADTVLCLVDPNACWDDWGDLCLSCLFAQGLPSVTFATQGLKDVPLKKRTEVKKSLQKQIERRFADGKLYALDSDQDNVLLLRHLAEQKLNRVKWRDIRPHVLADDVTFEPSETQEGRGTLKVTGFMRGAPLSVNGLVHLPGYGDFQMARIDGPADPCPLNPRKVKRKAKKDGDDMADDDEAETMEEGPRILEVADSQSQESLQAEAEPDPMAGEQTWPTEEELAEAEAALQEENKKQIVKRVPKGTSDYQATWIVESDDDEEDDEDDETGDEEDSEAEDDDDDVPIPESADSESVVGGGTEADDMEFDTVSISGGSKESYDVHFDEEAERKMLEKYREERMNEMFPDEIDTPMHTNARVRFARYRGLKSFRTSPWDPKENLPHDYARIFQFESFDRTKKRVLATKSDSLAEVGNYVTIHVSDVPRSVFDDYDPLHSLVVFGLLAHEQKMSVLHFTIRRHPDFTDPIKSKEPLIFQVGYRRFRAGPIFSQHTSGGKHKYERFLPKDSAVTVASVFAPIMFPPSTVLVFKELPDGTHNLVATGTLLGVNPDRIVVKRVVLSGHPFKIINRQAVVRYMFFNREDIMWFKPIELRTKWGRRGHIREPLGTHGHMKCIFDGKMKSQDTVLMNLYKRMYPKWTYDPVGWRSLNVTAPVPMTTEDEME